MALAVCTAVPVHAQDTTVVTDQSQAQNTLPGSDVPVIRDDPYLRLRGDTTREDPVLNRVRRTSRMVENTDRGVPVLDRQRKFYDPVGVALGSFILFPAITTTASYTNNVFRQSNERSDGYLSTRAESVLRSNWSRHALTVDGFVQKDLHAEYTTENNFTYRARATGRADIFGSDSINMQLLHERVVQDRGGTGDIIVTRRPIRHDHTLAELGAKIGGRGRFIGKAVIRYSDNAYSNSVSPEGVPLDQRFRDNEEYGITGQLGYQLSASRSLFLSVGQTMRRFSVDLGASRDVDTLEILGGIEGDVTPVIQGRFGVGYLRAKFDSANFKSQGGYAIDAQLDFLVTELTTVNFTARRALRNVAGVNSSAAFTTVFKIGVDHELLRNVIISPSAAYETANYTDSDRSAKLFNGNLAARWFISPRFRANASAEYRKRNADGFAANRDFSSIDIAAGLTWQL